MAWNSDFLKMFVIVFVIGFMVVQVSAVELREYTKFLFHSLYKETVCLCIINHYIDEPHRMFEKNNSLE